MKTKKVAKSAAPKYSVKKMTFDQRKEWVKNKFQYEVNALVVEATHQERIRIMNDPGTVIFGKPLDEVQRLVHLAEAGGTAAAYKKGFADALGTIKRVAEMEMSRLSV